jgi:hypothetical protein
LRRAELGDAAIEQVDLVVEVDNCFNQVRILCQCQCQRLRRPTIDSKPLIFILPFRQLNRFPQTPTTKRRLSELLELPARGPTTRILRSERRTRPRPRVTRK